MIRLQDLTPAIYYEQSRDFQFIGRLFDIVLNHIKTNADNLYTLPIGKNMNEQLLNLLALTLGFQSKHQYNSKQLLAICSVLPLVLKNKGSLEAITIAVNSLLYAEGIKQALEYEIKNGALTLYLPTELSELALLRDLLVYLLPAGMSCMLVREINEVYPIETILTTRDDVKIYIDNSRTINRLLNKDELAALGKESIGNSAGVLVNMTTFDTGTKFTKKINNGGSNND